MAFENISKGEWKHNRFAKGNIETENRLIANCIGYSTNVKPEEAHLESMENADFILFCGNLQQRYDISKLEEAVKLLESIAFGKGDICENKGEQIEQLLKEIKK